MLKEGKLHVLLEIYVAGEMDANAARNFDQASSLGWYYDQKGITNSKFRRYL